MGLVKTKKSSRENFIDTSAVIIEKNRILIRGPYSQLKISFLS